MHPGGNSTGTGGSPTSGAANSTGSPGAGGTTGSNPGTAGVGSGNAGTNGASGMTGSAGTGSGDAGTTGAGNATGAGGTGTGAGGTGTVMIADMIDHLDDNDGRIIQANGRQGPWHAFNDQNGGNQQPPVNGSFAPQSGGANSTPYAAHTSGSGYSFGGIGFGLNNPTTMPESSMSQAYNASAFTGIRFWAKGNGNLRVEFPQRGFVPTDRGGSCTGTCWNVYGTRALQGQLTSSWKQFTILFSSLQREDGSMSPLFDRSQLMGIAFKHEGSSFDFWVDEVEFVSGGGSTGSGGTTGSAGRGGTTGSAGRGGTTGAAGTTARGGTTGAAGTSATGQAGTSGSNEPMPPPITSGGQNAWASRYWDCCKPACGWTGNTGGRTPVRSCNMQNQPLSGYMDRNACEGGGTAFMCWNGAPWQVGPNLSYGYVAASGPNYSCGKCFQLQFTGSSHNGNSASTAALNGKTMIVQVINNGGVAQDQFDLLIPGGGVGALNACSNQWGVSNSDLGAQYGGFLAGCNGNTSCVQQKCQQIFGNKPDLLAGCNWFLGWYGAADNPNLIYKEIACPQMLKDRGLP
jgi:hypothetical protein